MLETRRQFQEYLTRLKTTLADTNFWTHEDLLEQIRFQELLVPVIGAFSVGKSSLINLLIGKRVLPEGLMPETELAAEIRYSPEAHVIGVSHDGREERFSLEDLSQVNRRSDEYAHLRVYVDSDVIRDLSPLILVDMPGYQSALDRHYRALNRYMPRGVHFVVLTSVEDGGLARSLISALDGINASGKEFSLVLSKCNLRSAEQLTAIAAHVQIQLETYFGTTRRVFQTNDQAVELAIQALEEIDSEQVFRRLFLERLRTANLRTQANIAVALATLNRTAQQIERDLDEHENLLRTLEQNLEAIHDQAEFQVERLVRRCLERVERELDCATEELSSRGSENSAVVRGVSELVREALTVTLSQEIPQIQESFLDTVIVSLQREVESRHSSWPRNDSLVDRLLDDDAGELKKHLRSVTHSLEDWVKYAEGRQAQAGSESSRAAYKVVTTVLAVTTSVIHPALELVIVFLPEILRVIFKGKETSERAKRLKESIYPALLSELRGELPPIISQQVYAVSKQVISTIHERVAEQKRVIEEIRERNYDVQEQHPNAVQMLHSLASSVSQLGNEYLGTGEADGK